MYSQNIKIIITVCFIALFGMEAMAQTYQERREELLKRQENTRAEINVLEARIKNYQDRVNQAEAEFDESSQKLQSLNNLMALQDDKINNLEEEQQQIEAEIQLTEQEIEQREEELDQLVENYKKIILYAYKNGRSGNLEILLTSESINQMLVRSNYLRRFDEQKTKQAETIRQARRELDRIKLDLEDSYRKNRDVIVEIRGEKQELDAQREQQAQTLEEIKQERSTWLAELRKSREEKENLENALTQWIEDEEALRNNSNTTITRENYVSDELLLTYESSFKQSKGYLPWPVNSTTVSKKFGRVRNPLHGTITEHPGIDIVVESSSPVKSVADGYVFKKQPLPGYGDVVFVKHGSYYTAYGNLSHIEVEVGTVLKQGDVIGLSGTTQSELGEVVFFLVRDGDEFVNPEIWLASK